MLPVSAGGYPGRMPLPLLTPEIVLTLAVASSAMGLFFWGKLPVDVVGLLVMAALICLGLVELRQGISGFSDEATLTVAAMLVLSAGLSTSGVIDVVSRWVARWGHGGEARLLAVIVLGVVPVSAFIGAGAPSSNRWTGSRDSNWSARGWWWAWRGCRCIWWS